MGAVAVPSDTGAVPPATWITRTIDTSTLMIGAQPYSRRAHRSPQGFPIASSWPAPATLPAAIIRCSFVWVAT